RRYTASCVTTLSKHSPPTLRSSDLGEQAEQLVVVLGDRLARPVLVDRSDLELLVGPSELHAAHSWGGSNLDVRCRPAARPLAAIDRKSTRLNSSHGSISYAVL